MLRTRLEVMVIARIHLQTGMVRTPLPGISRGCYMPLLVSTMHANGIVGTHGEETLMSK